MRILKKTTWIVFFIALLAILKIILDKYSHTTAVYHDLLIFDYQLFLWIWLLSFLIINISKKKINTEYFTLTLLSIFLISDAICYLMIAHPTSIPTSLRPAFKEYYTNYQRNIIQYENCTEYDSSFFYKLKPNTKFQFANVEFNNSYSVNKLGMRDDDSSINHSEIIFLGDSYTLGWGVNEEQTFSSLIKRQTNKRTLNTAMASYGTAREIKWLTKLDTSSLKYVVIQYCKNDVDENHLFNQKNFLSISSANVYENAKTSYHWSKRYFPGKYSLTILYSYLRRIIHSTFNLSRLPYYESNDPAASAQEFVKVLNHIPVNKIKTKILVFDLNDFDELNNQFISNVDSLLQLPQYQNLKPAVQTIDVSKILTKEDFYILDAHLKPSGHKKIAHALEVHGLF